MNTEAGTVLYDLVLNKYETIIILLILFVCFVALFSIIIITYLLKVSNVRDEKRRAKSKEQWEQQIEELGQKIVALGEKEAGLVMKKKEPVVIKVEHVSMKFRISTSTASGIKELMVQKLKNQVQYRTLFALKDVCFEVRKGDVVGIIGTNGSGKSTLLKIISGALRPSEGNVDVDKKKIQLLTLGTGFDMELSARENVYLNGAIIGYSKAFLDEHYDEIVAFAELDGFMDEKVKNFSSGMVSRLGFAIATVGDAADILILDEVLSVGDEFFRKKSLARVKEMIHGGSTVLLVSHGMGTILDNCNKVVWIERGELRMVGEPKEVCSAYRKQFEQAPQGV